MRGPIRTALALFTVLPVRADATLTRAGAVVALRWLPAVGMLLGGLAGLVPAAVHTWAPQAGLLGAVVAVGILALLTRGLHLDGLADTFDGLGSAAPAERARDIMHRSDIGPFGTLALVFVVLTDIAALAALPGGGWRPVAALALAAATGRLAALQAAHHRIPSACGTGFGAQVAGSVGTLLLAAQTLAALVLAGVLAAATGASPITWPACTAVALLVTAAFRQHATHRFGGMTGDVFGALVELATALALVGLALC